MIEWIAVLITYVGIVRCLYWRSKIPGERRFLFRFSPYFHLRDNICDLYRGSGSLIPAVGAIKFNSYAMSFAAVAVLTHFMLKAPSLCSGCRSVFMLMDSWWPSWAPYPFVPSVDQHKATGRQYTAVIASIGSRQLFCKLHCCWGESVSALEIAGTVFIYSPRYFGNQLEKSGTFRNEKSGIASFPDRIQHASACRHRQMRRRRKSYTFVFLHKRTDAPPITKEESDEIMKGHMANMQNLVKKESLLLGRPIRRRWWNFYFQIDISKDVTEWMSPIPVSRQSAGISKCFRTSRNRWHLSRRRKLEWSHTPLFHFKSKIYKFNVQEPPIP